MIKMICTSTYSTVIAGGTPTIIPSNIIREISCDRRIETLVHIHPSKNNGVASLRAFLVCASRCVSSRLSPAAPASACPSRPASGHASASPSWPSHRRSGTAPQSTSAQSERNRLWWLPLPPVLLRSDMQMQLRRRSNAMRTYASMLLSWSFAIRRHKLSRCGNLWGFLLVLSRRRPPQPTTCSCEASTQFTAAI